MAGWFHHFHAHVRGGTCEVSPDLRYLVVAAAGQGSPDYHITIVDLARPSSRKLSDERASDIAWSPGGDRLAATVDDRLLIIDGSGRTATRT